MIEEYFKKQKEKNRKSLIIYLTGGFPTEQITKQLLPTLVENGTDIIELGVPFSDPIADGPSIQKASETALKNGITLKKILEIVENFRNKYFTPLILFGAFNPFLKYGLKNLVIDAKNSGVDGFLAPDLPPEAGEEFRSLCVENDLCLVYLIAPTTSMERKKFIAEKSTGFIYCISTKGVTGARKHISPEIKKQVSSLKKITEKPIAVGFGVSKPEQVKYIAQFADGVVVGSAVINEISKYKNEGQILTGVSNLIFSLSSPLKKS